ncbi:MAG: hypothetical protein L6Q98_20870 [Anaerolineae bacterium]|nr:hypothetical protein [Anaerolineae bacterium]NUQ06263.1 hypothetical protein [Anaerolineae bacterium]
MSALEKQILEHVRKLDPDHQRRVLEFVTQLEQERPLSARELLQLPIEERRRRVAEAIDSAKGEDFETFEA